ncbi:MAG: GntR family transcriptional regulator [Spirochaetia bacterium]
MNKYEELKQIIINHIRDLTWGPGERLPSESYFCETFDVSRITIRRAKDELVSEGYLETSPGRKGHFIASSPYSSRKTGLIGVTIDDISIPFAASILKGIEDKLRENNLHTIICSGNYDTGSVKAFIESVQNRGVDGFIFTPIIGDDYQKKNMELIAPIRNRNLPIVFVDRYIENTNLSIVASDNYQISYELTNRIISQGKKRIILFKGVDCSSTDARWHGYKDALRDAGIPLDNRMVYTVNDLNYISNSGSRKILQRELRDYMDGIPEFDACFCLNHTSFELLNGYLAGKDPELLKELVIGTYDFQPTENFSFPFNLFSVIQQTYRIGWEAATLLMRSIQDPEHPIVQMTVKSSIITS